ncbi:MAG: hypothetical protein WAW92_02765 [Minisyncoccia bacterium]
MMNISVKKNSFKKGLTLIEIMVASSMFIIVMLIMSGAIVSVFSANQKSNNLRSVMDNLNLTLESMTRTIRFSKAYNCGSYTPLGSTYSDCTGGGSSDFTVTFNAAPIRYYLSSGRIKRSVGGVETFITSPEVNISSLNFIVSGSDPYDTLQPRVTIQIKGVAGGTGTRGSTFYLETTVSQRQFDFN